MAMRSKELKGAANCRGELVPIADSKSVLIVEDDIDQRESLSELLALNGYRVSCAENGKDALAKLNNTPIPPALIILDLTMPIMDGRAFMQRFRPRKPQTPVLVMTGEDCPAVTSATAVLNKPVWPTALLSFIKQFLP